jgi:1-deoxy-D-xylulose-5-phosphate reductoisomerase
MTLPQKTITILGSTGSIGVQTLQVIDNYRDKFKIGFLTAYTNIKLLAKQINSFNPVGVVVKDGKAKEELLRLIDFKGKILSGTEGLSDAASYENNDMVVSALVGFSGVLPTISAIQAGKTVALANKETLVAAGSIIKSESKKHNTKIIPVDSEHCAIMQCLAGENGNSVRKIILTASGGPFLNTSKKDFDKLTVSQALAHPNWSMGSKITIDSATMMNKGFEVIEAYWLFGLPADRIEVLIHPQSIVHSLVEFEDTSIKAQLGLPDMRIPIMYALAYPERLNSNLNSLKLEDMTDLSFFEPDHNKFPCLKLAYKSLETGGNCPAALNAANEIAVEAFLHEKLPFTGIHACIENVISQISVKQNPSIDDIIHTNEEARKFASNYIKQVKYYL